MFFLQFRFDNLVERIKNDTKKLVVGSGELVRYFKDKISIVDDHISRTEREKDDYQKIIVQNKIQNLTETQNSSNAILAKLNRLKENKISLEDNLESAKNLAALKSDVKSNVKSASSNIASIDMSSRRIALTKQSRTVFECITHFAGAIKARWTAAKHLNAANRKFSLFAKNIKKFDQITKENINNAKPKQMNGFIKYTTR